MIKRLFVIFITSMLSLHSAFGQDVKANLVVLCNERLVNGEMINLRIGLTKNEKVTYVPVDYVPGDLSLPRKMFDELMSDSVTRVELLFDLNSFVGQRHQILNFKTDFPKGLFSQSYLILNIFDFRDKKYKRQLGYLTKENFISEFSFPASGTKLVWRK